MGRWRARFVNVFLITHAFALDKGLRGRVTHLNKTYRSYEGTETVIRLQFFRRLSVQCFTSFMQLLAPLVMAW